MTDTDMPFIAASICMGASTESSELAQVVRAIDREVEALVEVVCSADPLSLLQTGFRCFALQCAVDAAVGRVSEKAIRFDQTVEYVLKILAAALPSATASLPREIAFSRCIEHVAKIFSAIHREYLPLAVDERLAHEGLQTRTRLEAELARFGAQVEWMQIRRTRYGAHDVPFLRHFLAPHDAALQRIFHVSAEQIVEGVAKIVHVHTQGVLREADTLGVPALRSCQEDLSDEENSLLQQALNAHGLQDRYNDMRQRVAAYQLPDVETLTGWTTQLLDALSWQVGAESSFLAPGEMRGWPLRSTPLRDRPLLKIDDRYYCFNTAALSNGLYRCLQRALIAAEPHYQEPWNKAQKEASETFVFDRFAAMLRGAPLYRNAHYKWRSGSKLERAESDLVAIYDDYLFIVECKAGAFISEAPDADPEGHLKALQQQVSAPARQASRLRETLLAAGSLDLFSEQQCLPSQRLCTLRASGFRVVMTCGVTLDAFLGYGARDVSLLSLGIETGSQPYWSANAEDLLVYQDAFDMPVTFLHFVRQRLQARNNARMNLEDDLAHLGMFLNFNDYAERYAELPGRFDKVIMANSMAAIDRHYDARTKAPHEPHRLRPRWLWPRIDEVIRHLSDPQNRRSTRVWEALLDMPYEQLAHFEVGLRAAIARLREAPLVVREDVCRLVVRKDVRRRFAVMCVRNDPVPGDQLVRDYAAGMMLEAGVRSWLMAVLAYDRAGKLGVVKWCEISSGDIEHAERVPLRRLGVKLAGSVVRVSAPKNAVCAGGNEPGRNEPCPCGCGLKYKECLGRRRS